MKRVWTGMTVVVLMLSLVGPASAQTLAQAAASQPVPVEKPEKEIASFNLAFAGLLTIIGGAAIVSTGGETYSIADSKYCVSGNTVERGACQPVWDGPMAKKVSLITMGAGGLMLYLGLRKVDVKPQVGRGVAGVAATVKF